MIVERLTDEASLLKEIWDESDTNLTDDEVHLEADQRRDVDLLAVRDQEIMDWEFAKLWLGDDIPDRKIRRLRSVERQDLRDLELPLRTFVFEDASPFFGAGHSSGLDIVDLFRRWLAARSFRCECCGHRYIPLEPQPRGRPRRFCSNACKQSAWRSGRTISKVSPHGARPSAR